MLLISGGGLVNFAKVDEHEYDIIVSVSLGLVHIEICNCDCCGAFVVCLRVECAIE